MAHPTLAAVLLAATLFLGSAISPLPKKLSAIPAYPKKVAPRGRKNLWAAKDPVVVPPLVALTTPVVTEDDPEVPTKDPEDVPAVAITTPVVTEDDSSEVPPNRSPPAHRLIHKFGSSRPSQEQSQHTCCFQGGCFQRRGSLYAEAGFHNL